MAKFNIDTKILLSNYMESKTNSMSDKGTVIDNLAKEMGIEIC